MSQRNLASTKLTWTDLATVRITPIATRKHPSSWLSLYRLPRKINERRICHTRKACKIIKIS